MTPMLNGFADELVKVATGAVDLAAKLPPQALARAKRMGISAGLMGGVHGVLNPGANLEDMARAGVGLSAGDYAGSRAAKALGAGKWGRIGGGLAGALAGAQLLKKRRKRD